MTSPITFPVHYKTITSHNAACFRADLLEVACNSPCSVIVDMTNVDAIDQYAFGILFLVAEVVSPAKKMAVVLQPKLIRELKESTGYRGILKVAESISEAKDLLAESDVKHPSEDSICVST